MQKENQTEIKLAPTLAALVGFGVGYNALVDWLERHGYDRGMTSLLVVAGTGITLLAFVPIYGWRIVGGLIAGFGASGAPMIIGSLQRYIKERAHSEKQHRIRAQRHL
jgi:MFS family permease